MNSIGDEDSQRSNSASDSSLSTGSFFIPGITAKARCLTSPQTLLDQQDERTNGPYNLPPRRQIRRAGSGHKDIRFSKMLGKLTAERKAADEARQIAMQVLERFENEGSAPSQHADAIFQELRKHGNPTSMHHS